MTGVRRRILSLSGDVMSKGKRKSEGPQASAADGMRSLIEAAERGDPEAQHNVGACYATGDWDGPKDEAEAIKWYTMAAQAGHAMSQYDLGFMLILGEGTEKDIEKGLWWMEQAANTGEAYASRVLSDIYQKGLFGVGPDSEKAHYWFERAGDIKS